jgi:hypothetical protein
MFVMISFFDVNSRVVRVDLAAVDSPVREVVKPEMSQTIKIHLPKA